MSPTITYWTDAASVRATPGDLIVCATNGFVGRCIRIATGGWCNHAATVVSTDGGPIVSQETPGGGDVFTNICNLGATKVAVISLDCSIEQRNAGVALARRLKGAKYGFAPCAADLFSRVVPIQVGFTLNDHLNCSAATSWVAVAEGWVPSMDPNAYTPIALARAFGAGDFIKEHA